MVTVAPGSNIGPHTRSSCRLERHPPYAAGAPHDARHHRRHREAGYHPQQETTPDIRPRGREAAGRHRFGRHGTGKADAIGAAWNLDVHRHLATLAGIILVQFASQRQHARTNRTVGFGRKVVGASEGVHRHLVLRHFVPAPGGVLLIEILQQRLQQIGPAKSGAFKHASKRIALLIFAYQPQPFPERQHNTLWPAPTLAKQLRNRRKLLTAGGLSGNNRATTRCLADARRGQVT